MKTVPVLLILIANAAIAFADDKPNVIFILADDLGYGSVGAYGQNKILTPHIDQLAKDGMKFTDHYSGQTVCTPSRAALMLGQHMGHCSVKRNGERPESLDVTVPQLFKKKGYTTGMIGKWGLMAKGLGPWADKADRTAVADEHDEKFANFLYPNNAGFDHRWFSASRLR